MKSISINGSVNFKSSKHLRKYKTPSKTKQTKTGKKNMSREDKIFSYFHIKKNTL